MTFEEIRDIVAATYREGVMADAFRKACGIPPLHRPRPHAGHAPRRRPACDAEAESEPDADILACMGQRYGALDRS